MTDGQAQKRFLQAWADLEVAAEYAAEIRDEKCKWSSSTHRINAAKITRLCRRAMRLLSVSPPKRRKAQ